MDLISTNETLKTLSRTLYGESLVLMVVDPRTLRLLTKNARIFSKDSFQQLIANIRQDKRLSSVPLCHRMKDGALEILSGNHRVEASIQADVAYILVMVIEEDLSTSQKIAVQLSHNSLSGTDDPVVLAELWAQIEDVESKLYAGLSSDVVERLEKIELVGFTTPQVFTRTLTLAFVDTEVAHFNAVLEQLDSLPSKEVHVADLQHFDRFFSLLEAAKKNFDVRNTSLAVLKLLDLCEDVLKKTTLESEAPA